MLIAALSSSEVKRGKAIGVKRLGLDLVVWRRTSGRVWTLRDLCPHRRARLSLSNVAGDHIEYPYHGFQFNGNGNVLAMPAMGRAAPLPAHIKASSIPTHEEFVIIWLWYGEGEPSSGPRFFDDLAGLSARGAWRGVAGPASQSHRKSAHVFHLPFVHRNTIGRRGRAVTQGPAIKMIDEASFKVYPHNEVDVGQKLLRAEQVDVTAQESCL